MKNGLLILALAGGAVVAEEELGIDDTKRQKQVLAEAVTLDSLEQRGRGAKRAWYPRDKRVPYKGWSKKVIANGRVTNLAHLKNGRLHGSSLRWDAGGAKSEERNYKNGKEHGLMKMYYPDGEKQIEGRYEMGFLQGVVTRWHPNGEMFSKGPYKGGKPNGVLVVWDKDGKEVSKTLYKDGKPSKE